jgi:hypothetical protein
MSFEHPGHPVDGKAHERLQGKEFHNEISPELRRDMGLDPRLLGARVEKDGSQSTEPIQNINRAKNSEWVFWERQHDGNRD